MAALTRLGPGGYPVAAIVLEAMHPKRRLINLIGAEPDPSMTGARPEFALFGARSDFALSGSKSEPELIGAKPSITLTGSDT